MLEIKKIHNRKLAMTLYPENSGHALYSKIGINNLRGFLIALTLIQDTLLVKMSAERDGKIYFSPLIDNFLNRNKLSTEVVVFPYGGFSKEFNIWYENFKK